MIGILVLFLTSVESGMIIDPVCDLPHLVGSGVGTITDQAVGVLIDIIEVGQDRRTIEVGNTETVVLEHRIQMMRQICQLAEEILGTFPMCKLSWWTRSTGLLLVTFSNLSATGDFAVMSSSFLVSL